LEDSDAEMTAKVRGLSKSGEKPFPKLRFSVKHPSARLGCEVLGRLKAFSLFRARELAILIFRKNVGL
jgi:hypothetical protein